MTYSAEQIHLTQTDEQGNLYVRAQIDRLEQDMQQKTSKLENLNASMYKAGAVDATFLLNRHKVLMTMKRLCCQIKC